MTVLQEMPLQLMVDYSKPPGEHAGQWRGVLAETCLQDCMQCDMKKQLKLPEVML
jgi:hypothetical protein